MVHLKKKWISRLISIGLALLMARYAEARVVLDDPGSPIAIRLVDSIGPDEASVFSGVLDQAKVQQPAAHVMIFLNNIGGDVLQALLIGQKLQNMEHKNPKSITTVVLKDRDCSSSCVIVFLAARQREMMPNSRLGVHRTSSAVDGSVGAFQLDLDKKIASYYRLLGMPETGLQRMLSTPPEGISWLTDDEITQLGINRTQ